MLGHTLSFLRTAAAMPKCKAESPGDNHPIVQHHHVHATIALHVPAGCAAPSLATLHQLML